MREKMKKKEKEKDNTTFASLGEIQLRVCELEREIMALKLVSVSKESLDKIVTHLRHISYFTIGIAFCVLFAAFLMLVLST